MSSGREVEPEMSDSELDPTADNQWVDEMLQDPAKKAFLLRKLGLEDPPSDYPGLGAKSTEKGNTPADSSGGKNGSGPTGPFFSQTPCGTFMGFGPGGMIFPPALMGGPGQQAQQPIPLGYGWGCPMPAVYPWRYEQGPSGTSRCEDSPGCSGVTEMGKRLSQLCIGVCHGLATIGSVSPVAGYPAGLLQCSILEGKFMFRVSSLARG